MLFYELWQLACCRQQLCIGVCSTVCITESEKHFEHLKIVTHLIHCVHFDGGQQLMQTGFVMTCAQCPEHWMEWFCSYQHKP